ncbi:predicted protein [Naegleria gruberi]|uniref:Predicted protein n=1 Tax=Naegleria gruberi TaxID=5762 RepID=D2V3I8_NAEGR|nr:uncharacterized protein NAEGRDRAFT_46398 [Naegleria gruberi]EFC48644.1 predicted protein [Naegleria gruberi]|eukprot:XP_002681388.1 predicted protein [Naegleria gruberi strain NEG-M]
MSSETKVVSDTSVPLYQVDDTNKLQCSTPTSSTIHLFTKSILTSNKQQIIGDLNSESTTQQHPIEPGNIHCSRLASDLNQASTVYFINKSKLFKIKYELPSSEVNVWKPTKNAKLPYPLLISDIDVTKIYQSTLDVNFQGIEIDKNRIGLTDDMGNIYILNNTFSTSNNEEDDEETDNSSKKRKVDEKSTIQCVYNNIDTIKYHVKGHTSLKFHPTNEAVIIKSTFETKNVSIFDINNQKSIFSVNTMQNPTKLHTFEIPQSNNTLLAIGEYNNVSIWDFRTNKPVNRLTRTRGIVYDMDITTNVKCGKNNSNALLGVIGSDRTVYMYDTMKWSPIHKWQNCLKYAPSYLSFSNINKELCYVAGFDNSEFKCGNFVDQKQQRKGRGHGLYADNRWIGMTKPNAQDTIVGISMNGSLYVIEHPHRMAPNLNDLVPSTEAQDVMDE